MKQSNFIMIIICMVGALFLHLSQPLLAQEDEISQLQKKITALEIKIKELEIVLQKCNEMEKKKVANEYSWQNTKNWRRLETGMTEVQVKTILGEPVKIIRGVKTLWYYPNPDKPEPNRV